MYRRLHLQTLPPPPSASEGGMSRPTPVWWWRVLRSCVWALIGGIMILPPVFMARWLALGVARVFSWPMFWSLVAAIVFAVMVWDYETWGT